MKGESEVIKLVNVFLDGLVSIGNDAGWPGDTVLAKWIEFQGAPPKGTGMDQSNQSMINAMSLYRPKHHQFPVIENIVWRLFGNPATRRHVMALLTRHYYHGINERTDRTYTEDDRIALWVEHLNRYPWSDREIMGMNLEDARVKYRYGLKRAAPRLIRRELMFDTV